MVSGVKRCAIRSARASSSTVSPYPDFTSTVGRALRAHLRQAPFEQGAETLVARGAGVTHRRGDAAAVVTLPRHARRELRRAVAVEHEVGVAVDETRQDGGAVDVVAPIGRWCVARVPHPDDPVVLDDDGRVLAQPEQIVAVLRGIIGDQFRDAGDDGGAHGVLQKGSMASCSSAPTSPRR